ncbi:MAG: T9SS type A sorting domain-containing protein, partial [Bacteroidota bacterium]
PATVTLTEDHRLILTVDDSKAVYPITVDPLNHAPAQTFQGNNVLGSGLIDATIHMLFGFSISGAGDVNGDNIDDIIIGSPTFTQITAITGGTLSANVTVTGAAFVYYGALATGPSSTPSKVLQPTGLAANSLFGYSVSTAGKFDGSTTRSGVVVGAPADKITLMVALLPTLVATGKVYVYSGNAFSGDVNSIPTPSATLSLTAADFSSPLFTPPANPFYGFSVSNAGNMDGDAFDDIVVGSPYYTTSLTGIAAGRVDIYKGGATGIITTPATTIAGQTASSLVGFSVSSAGKVNGGAFDAVIAGAPGFLAATGQLQGHAYLFYGKSGGVTATTISGADQILAAGSGIIASLYGFSVSGAGDVNADGFDDVIVGEPLALDLTGAAGKAYIYYGSATGIVPTGGTTLVSPRSPTILGLGVGANLLFGYSVGKAGNATGDAGGEVLVGEPGSLALTNPVIATLLALLNGTSTISGQAYLFKGSVGAHIPNNAAPFLTINDPGALSVANLLGESVHYVGDVNKDGFDDFMVSSPNGTLDLGLNLSLLPVVSTASGAGLITTASTGSVYLYNGFTGPLPITWLSFTGSPEKNDVLLNWATAEESNSDHFEIERSTDNSNFASIGQVTAAHNSSAQTNYSFTDGSPANGINYYRLREVDLDGQFIYSKVISVTFNGTDNNVIAVYPNPAHESFQLQFKNMKAGRYEMNLINPLGQILQSRTIQVSNPSSYAETVPLGSGLAQGTYVVRIVDQQQQVYITRVMVR